MFLTRTGSWKCRTNDPLKPFTLKGTSPFFIAFLLSSLVYFHNNIFIDFADEGFLWYGAQHVLKGQVPMLDFQAYDPGRYYWCAAVLAVLGKGLMSLRLAAGLFQFLGLSLGLFALRRVVSSHLFLFAAGLWAVLFMLVPCRYFTASLPPIALFFAVRLVENPSTRRHITAGICTGLAVFIAINHGFYLFLGFSALILYLSFRDGLRSFAKKYVMYTAGIGLGLIPLWFMFVAIPGFFESYCERFMNMAAIFWQGKANVRLPIPWPWTVDWVQISSALPDTRARVLEYANRFSIGMMFILVIFYYIFSLPTLARRKKSIEPSQALHTASTFIGMFYLGHIFARADLVYLGEGIFPVLAGFLALKRDSVKKVSRTILSAGVIIFALTGFLSAGLRSTLVFKTMVTKSGMTWYSVGQDRIWLLRQDAEYCDSVKKLVAKYVKPDEPLLLAPLLTTFYCLLDRPSPVHELYFHLAPLRSMEERTLKELEEKKVRWAIVGNLVVDGRPEQTLSRSHPLLWEYLNSRFESVSTEGLRPGYSLLKRKD